jgi:hypothetical protein
VSYYDNNGHQDDARPIPIGNYGKQPAATQPKRSWARAFGLFLRSKDAPLLLRLAPAWPLAYQPVNLATTALIPGVGLLDDAGSLVVAAYVIHKINQKRDPSNDK